jgi:hypothetical protein
MQAREVYEANKAAGWYDPALGHWIPKYKTGWSASSCEAPVLIGFHPAYPDGLWVRCRRCRDCARSKARQWAKRTIAEIGTRKAWFVTLTYRTGADTSYASVQRWLKRVRKSGAKIRYIITEEYGSKTGRFHRHAIVVGDVTQRQLRQRWEDGISQAKLVRSSRGAAWYVSKYLTKAGGKIRASGRWGRQGEARGFAAEGDGIVPYRSDSTGQQTAEEEKHDNIEKGILDEQQGQNNCPF